MKRALAVMATALWLGCAGEGGSSSSGTGGGVGGTTGTTGATTGTTGTMCTNDYTGAGQTAFPGMVAGSCVTLDAPCGTVTCKELVGPGWISSYQADPTHFAATVCGDSDEQWMPGVTCPSVVADLSGGCEIANSAEGATQEWTTAGPYECYSCSQLCTSVSNPSGPPICLVPPIQGAGFNCPDVMVTTATMGATATATTTAAGGGGSSGSTSGQGTTGGVAGTGGSSGASTTGASAPTCTAVLSGGPITGSPSFACSATALAGSVGVTFFLNPASSAGGDGGWTSASEQTFLVTFSDGVIADGTFVGGDGGTWGAHFTGPSGAPTVQSMGVGSMVINVTDFALTGGNNANLSGTATVVVPGFHGNEGDGGYVTATYQFSD